MTEWQLYAQKIEGDSWAGEKIEQGKLEKMSGEFPGSQTTHRGRRRASADVCPGSCVEEQIQQLYELMQAIQKHRTDRESD